MSVTRGVFKAHAVLQTVVYLPYHLSRLQFRASLKLEQQTQFQFLQKYFVYVSMTFYFTFTMFRLLCLFFNFNTISSNKKIEELVFYITVLVLVFIGSTAYHFVDFHHQVIIYTLNQRLLQLPPNHQNIVPYADHLILLLFFSCAAFPLLGFAIPFFTNYTHLQLIWQMFCCRIVKHKAIFILLIKIIDAICYLIVLTNGALTLTSLTLLIICITEGVFFLSKGIWIKFVNKLKFYKCFMRYQRIRIIILTFNSVAHNFLQNVVAYGIIIGSCALVTVVNGHKDLPVFITMLCTSVVVMVFTLTITMTILADAPYSNGITFKRRWNQVTRRSKFFSKILASCPTEIGYQIGCIRNVKRSLGLSIVDTIVDFTINLVFMKTS